jgi:hypothetical protein
VTAVDHGTVVAVWFECCTTHMLSAVWPQ